MKFLVSAALAAAVVVSAPAQAVTFTYTATTAGAPTYNRTLVGTPPTALSAVGTAVRYNALTFTVGTAGTYTFLDTSTYDNFMTLYQGSFLPGSPLTNALVAADDTTGSNAGFSRALALGTTYVAVMTSFENADFGAFTLTIDGPGTVITGATPAVPEPAAWAMFIAGFGLVGGALRRRQRVTVRFA